MKFSILTFLIVLLVQIFHVPYECYGNKGKTISRQITDAQWELMTEGKAFAYRGEKEISQTRKPNSAGTYLSHLLNSIIVFFASPLGKTILWILVFLIVSLALLKILVYEQNLFGRKIKKEESEPKSDQILTDDLLHTNWEERLQLAIKEKDLRLAIRLGYLMLLQLLQKKEQIQYRPDKTNYDYYHEIRDVQYRKNFRFILSQYEFAWYGNYAVTHDQLDRYIGTLNQFQEQLRHS